MEEKKKGRVKKFKKKAHSWRAMHVGGYDSLDEVVLKNKFEYVQEKIKKKEEKFEHQNRYKMIKDICQK